MYRYRSSPVWLVFALMLACVGATVSPVQAQTPDTTQQADTTRATPSMQDGRSEVPAFRREGIVALENWPEVSLNGLLREMGRRAPRLLPRIDSMGLDYVYTTRDTSATWTFTVAWRPGSNVLVEGDVKRWQNGPPDVRMTSFEVLADVLVAGQREAEMVIAVDSMALRPEPDVYTFTATVGHDRVFLDTEADAARRYLREGITLANLRVERIGFNSFGTSTGDASRRSRTGEDTRRNREPAPRTAPSVYEPRIGIAIGWRIGPDPYYVGRPAPAVDAPRAQRPRDANVGRSDDDSRTRRTPDRGPDRTSDTRTGDASDAERGDRGSEGTASSGRSGRTSGSDSGRKSGSSRKKGDKDEEEDDEDLLVAAAATAAAVGVLAYAGGTVGLSGTGDTPLGLTAGYTQPSGGVQLQASVNSAVLNDEGTQRLSVKALGFYDVFQARIQPALGLGVQAEARQQTEFEPAVSAGLVGNFGRFVVYGGFDVAQQTPEFGLAYNFRARRDASDDAIAER